MRFGVIAALPFVIGIRYGWALIAFRRSFVVAFVEKIEKNIDNRCVDSKTIEKSFKVAPNVSI